MNKILLNFFILFLIFFGNSCSYKPIFKEGVYNFIIEDISFEGEKDINRIIENKLSLIKKNTDLQKNKYDIVIYSEKKKVVISNDSKGDPLKFEISILVNYKLRKNEKILLDKEIIKKSIYNNDSNKFELERDEDIILKNLSEKIGEDIISSIININDN